MNVSTEELINILDDNKVQCSICKKWKDKKDSYKDLEKMFTNNNEIYCMKCFDKMAMQIKT